MEKLTFSTFGYYLDQSDPDVLILRRKDGEKMKSLKDEPEPRETQVSELAVGEPVEASSEDLDDA